jgi:hypothetical protein
MSYEHPTNHYRVVDAHVFAQVEATKFTTRFSSQLKKSVPTVDGARIVAITQKRPDKPKPGCIVVELTIRIPEAAFLPMQPTAVIDIPDTFTAISALIETEAADVNEEGVVAAWAAAATKESP